MTVLSNMEESFKTSEFNLKFIPNAWKRETIARKTSLEGCSLKIEILPQLLLFFI